MGAFYKNSINGFLSASNEHIIGSLTQKSGLAGFQSQLHKQTASWDSEIAILKDSFRFLKSNQHSIDSWIILLEYPIARRDKRIDVIVLAGDAIVIMEFKSGSSSYHASDKEQLLDYCLDIRDFHFESRGKIIYPVLVATSASDMYSLLTNTESVQPMRLANKENLNNVLVDIAKQTKAKDQIDCSKWDNSAYAPTPTIIEAAQTLFAGKSVEEISRSHAGTKNLTRTTDAILEAVSEAKKYDEKIICFITGVPGAGKTLAGLNIAHQPEFQNEEGSLATFLSGNGPLIKVLRKALSRDSFNRLKIENSEVKKKEQERIIAFIENVHRFIDVYFFDKEKIPNNRIVIFDEAQRAWNAEHSKRKFNRDFSEPEMMFDIMNRHEGWAVIVALVGGGQEINTGEAGLREWGDNIRKNFADWKVYISPELKVGDHSTGNLTLFDTTPVNVKVVEHKDLHLQVALRSYKAENLSNWVHLVLSNQPDFARELFVSELNNYPLAITRDLQVAKKWLREKCQGTRRMGLVASSGGRRLRPMGVEVKIELEEEHWFLNGRDDVRSSYALEIPATEFGIQGLELDWVGVCWDADLRRTQGNWEVRAFKGSAWQKVNKEDAIKFSINKYRVLLTRAREGMVIYIPLGDLTDQTRPPEFYDPIYEYLKSCGVSEL